MSGKDLQFPEGMSEGQLIDIVKREFKDVQVKSVEMTSGSTAGDNNLSEVSRYTVHFTTRNEEKRKSFIIKDAQKAPGNFARLVNGIEKENSWYADVNPEIKKLGVKVGATSYTQYNEWLLLEDLSELGYKVLDRKAMLDLDHCFIAIEALARFHAVTHHLYEMKKIPDKIIENTVFTPENKTSIYNNLKIFDYIVDNLKEMGETKYCGTIQALKPISWNKMMHCMEINHDFLTLVHGDYWTTNILFKYDENKKVSDAKIIDYQLLSLSSPAYDLHFFVCTSIQPQVRDNHLDEIFKVYLKTLNSTLKSINSKTLLSQEQFDKIMKSTEFMGIFITLTFLPVPLCESPLKFQPPQDLSEEDKKNYHAFKEVLHQKTYRKHLLPLLDFYKRNEVI